MMGFFDTGELIVKKNYKDHFGIFIEKGDLLLKLTLYDYECYINSDNDFITELLKYHNFNYTTWDFPNKKSAEDFIVILKMLHN